MPKTINLKYFKIEEFASPDDLKSGSKMDAKFLEKLDYARQNAGVPFKINSGYRTLEWNAKIGGRVGVGKLMSSHCKGLAVDIHCNNSRNRGLIINALISVGIRRIGIAKTFIHCDLDKDNDQNVIWLYN